MTTEVSVTPKERVNITYKVSTGNAVEEQELPLKLMVIGDFKRHPDETPINHRVPENVNKDNFNNVLAGMNLSLAVEVPNRLEDGPEPKNLSLKLDIRKIQDFEPDQLVEQIPELRKLMQLRRALLLLKGPLGDVPAFRKKLEDVLMKDSSSRDQLLAELNLAPRQAD